MDPIVGEIKLFAFNYIPHGWMPCDGRTLTAQHHQLLYAQIGNTYGGSGNTFCLPDLQGRAPIGQGGGESVPPVGFGQAVNPPYRGLVEGGPQADPSVTRWVGTPGFLAMTWCIAVEGLYPERD